MSICLVLIFSGDVRFGFHGSERAEKKRNFLRVCLHLRDQIWSGTSTGMSTDNTWSRTSCPRRLPSSFRIKTPSAPWCSPSMDRPGRERRWLAQCSELICTAGLWAARTSTSLSPRCIFLHVSSSTSTGWVDLHGFKVSKVRDGDSFCSGTQIRYRTKLLRACRRS